MMEEAIEIKGARDFIEKVVRPLLEQGIPFVVVVHEGTESRYYTKGAVDQTFVGMLATHCVTPADLAGGRESSEVITEWSNEVLERMSVPKTPIG